MDLLKEIERLRVEMAESGLASHDNVRRSVLVALMRAAESYLQPDLFEVPHQKKSATSREAARNWRPKARSAGMMVLRCVASFNGLTREEVCNVTGILNQTAAGRLNVLKRANLIRVEGKRPSQTTGFNQEVYFIADRGRAFLEQEGAKHGKDDGNKAA